MLDQEVSQAVPTLEEFLLEVPKDEFRNSLDLVDAKIQWEVNPEPYDLASVELCLHDLSSTIIVEERVLVSLVCPETGKQYDGRLWSWGSTNVRGKFQQVIPGLYFIRF